MGVRPAYWAVVRTHVFAQRTAGGAPLAFFLFILLMYLRFRPIIRGNMDAVAAAVTLIGQQAALDRLDAIGSMIQSGEEAKQDLVDLILSSTGAGKLYSASGQVASTTGKSLSVQV